MQYTNFGNTWLLRIDLGEEIMQSLKRMCDQELDGFMEITSLTGNVSFVGGAPYIHLHATLADQQHRLHGGHVIEMRVGATCEMFVQALDGEIGRERNGELGINLWKF